MATASKVLNARTDVAAGTRERVLAAVAELGYRRTTAAAAEAPLRALVVAFDIPASPYIMNVLQGVLASATDAGLDLLTRLAPDRTQRSRRSAARGWVAAQRAAGAIGVVGLTLSAPDALLEAAADAGLPFVMVDPIDTRNEGMVSVASSNWAGSRAATAHLVALGHRRIGWIGGPDSSNAARDRFYGYRAALDAAGIEPDGGLVRAGQFDVGDGARSARELLALAEPPTAIMAADDEIAVGVLATAHALGVKVPQQLSVVGFDDTPQAAWTTPPLTSVRQHLDGMGRMAVETVVAMASGARPASRHIELATSLTVRETVGPAPGTEADEPSE